MILRQQVHLPNTHSVAGLRGRETLLEVRQDWVRAAQRSMAAAQDGDVLDITTVVASVSQQAAHPAHRQAS